MFTSWAQPYNSLAEMFNISFRYLLFTGSFYFVFYVWKRNKYWFSKIQQRYPEKEHIFNEIKYSIISMFIFGGVVAMVIWAGKKGLTLVYTTADNFGYPYYFFSIVLMILLHDTYFYWTHRLLHWKPLFKLAHKTHHLSVNPTPFAAYAFHPFEALIEVGIIPLIAFTIPHHPSALGFFQYTHCCST